MRRYLVRTEEGRTDLMGLGPDKLLTSAGTDFLITKDKRPPLAADLIEPYRGRTVATLEAFVGGADIAVKTSCGETAMLTRGDYIVNGVNTEYQKKDLDSDRYEQMLEWGLTSVYEMEHASVYCFAQDGESAAILELDEKEYSDCYHTLLFLPICLKDRIERQQLVAKFFHSGLE